jgi:hypothetical protein
MSLALVVGLCAALVALLVLVLCRSRQEEAGGSHEAPNCPEPPVRLPDRALLDRCLSSEDLAYVSSFESQSLLRLFVRERRRLAVAWLRQTRREAQRLLGLHVRSVRYAADLRPGAEAKLFLAAGLFLLIYGAMLGIVSWYGPLRTRRFLESVQGLAGVLSRLGEGIAASIASGGLPAASAEAGAAR